MKRALPMIMFLSIAFSGPVWAGAVYERKTGLLSADYSGAPLREVLGEIGRQTGIEIYLDPAVDKKVFIKRTRLPIDEVLREIIRPLNHMFRYQGEVLRSIKIYEDSPADEMTRITPVPRETPPPPVQRTEETVPAPETAPAAVEPPAAQPDPGEDAAQGQQIGQEGAGEPDATMQEPPAQGLRPMRKQQRRPDGPLEPEGEPEQ